MTAQRARSDLAKAARRAEIIEATKARLAEQGLHAVSMQDIANTCHLTKPALYNYFSTREALFLAVYRHLLEDWLRGFNRSLLEAGHPLPRASFNKLFVAGFAARPLLCHLTNHLTATLDPKLTEAALASLRAETADQIAGLKALLLHYGYVDADGAADLAWAYYTIMVGAAQVAARPEGMGQAEDRVIPILERTAFEVNCLVTLGCLR